MSVREYIGARYVPIFSSPLEWDPTKTYEPLTIVLYQGNSFTSRQYVPTGIGIDNTAYWAQTGNYNAQVEQYRAEVETYDGRITTNANDIDDLEGVLPKSNFSAANTVKKYVDDTATSLQNDISTALDIIPASNFDSTNTVKKYVDDTATDLQASIAQLQDVSERYFLFIGDSYGAFNGAWPDICASRLGLASTHYVNAAVSGASFNGTEYQGSPTPKYIEQLSNASALAIADKITDIVLCGGINDCTPTDYSVNTQPPSIATAVANFKAQCDALYPNARVYAGFIGAAREDSSVLYGRGFKNQTWGYFNWINELAENGIAYLNGVENIMRRSAAMFDTDGLHPNATGQTYLGSGIANAILTGCCTCNYPWFPADQLYQYHMKNDIVEIYLLFDYPAGAQTIRFDTASPQLLVQGLFGTTLYFNNPHYVMGVLNVLDSNNTNYMIDTTFVFSGNSLYIIPNAIGMPTSISTVVTNIRVPMFTVPSFDMA